MESNQRKINVVLGLMVAMAVMQGFMLRRSLSTAEKAVQEQESAVKDRMRLLATDLERLGEAVNGVTSAAGRFSSTGAHQIDGTIDDFNHQLEALNGTFAQLSSELGKEYSAGGVHAALARYRGDLADAGAWVADQNGESGTIGASMTTYASHLEDAGDWVSTRTAGTVDATLKTYTSDLADAGTAAYDTTISHVADATRKYDDRLGEAAAGAEKSAQTSVEGSLKKFDDAVADAGHWATGETGKRVDAALNAFEGDVAKASHNAASTAAAGVEDYFRPNGAFQRAMEAKAGVVCSCACDRGRTITSLAGHEGGTAVPK